MQEDVKTFYTLQNIRIHTAAWNDAYSVGIRRENARSGGGLIQSLATISKS